MDDVVKHPRRIFIGLRDHLERNFEGYLLLGVFAAVVVTWLWIVL